MAAVALKSNTELQALVDRALKGENVSLTRGRRPVASIVPVTGESIYVFHALTEAQNARLDKRIARERAQGRLRSFASAEEAAEALQAEWPTQSAKRPRK